MFLSNGAWRLSDIVRVIKLLLILCWLTYGTSSVHILSGDLILHKRTLEPIKTLVYGLRRYDVDRCAALVDSSGQDTSNVKIEGFMSHKSKIYLADVYDHIDFIIISLDMFSGTTENLINYSFNVGVASIPIFLFTYCSHRWHRMRWMKSCKLDFFCL